ALESTANDYITRRVNSVDLKNRLSDIETDRRDRLHAWLLRIVGASTAPTSMALPCRWRSRPQHQKRTNAGGHAAATPPRRAMNSRRLMGRTVHCLMGWSVAIRDQPSTCAERRGWRWRLVRFARRYEDAVRRSDTAAVQLTLHALRFLFHAHPAQFSNQPDQLVRLLSCRPVGRLLLFARHSHKPSHMVALFVALIGRASISLASMTAAPCGARLPVRATTRGSRTAVASSAQPSIVESGRQKVSVLSETAVSYQTYPHART